MCMTDNVQTKFIHADGNVQWVEIIFWVAFLCYFHYFSMQNKLGDEISLGLFSMAVCFDFRSTNVV